MIDTPISSSVGCLPSASTIMETNMHSMPANVPGDGRGLAFLLAVEREWAGVLRRHA